MALDATAKFEKLQTVTRADQVSAELMRYIEANGLKPGDKLPSEATLAVEFGVSRPVVREAMRDLSGKGVVQVVNGRGAVVRPLEIGPLQGFFDRTMLVGGDDTVLELMEVRRGLEAEAATLAAERRNSASLDRLTELTRAMAEAVDDEERYSDLDVEFHVQVAKATGNVMLGMLVESIREALRKAVLRGLKPLHEHSERDGAQRIHEEILDAIVRGAPDAAAAAMTRHFDVAIQNIRDGH